MILQEQVLAAIKTILTGLTTTGSNVFRHYAYDTEESDFPALKIRMDTLDTLDQIDTDWENIDWELTVNIEIVVRGIQGELDTELNKIYGEVWLALMADRFLGLSFVPVIYPRGHLEPNIDNEGSQPITTMITEWFVRYRTKTTDLAL